MIKENAKGMYVTHIANELGRDPKTIRKWLEQDEPNRYQRTNKRIGKLDAYKNYIRQRMEDGCLNAVVIYDEIKLNGYIGGIYHPSLIYEATEAHHFFQGYRAL
ncbi:hypothetical protein [Paenibacillus sp. IHBB 10380]|uniref:hypothetical protein n=1 Tax=Paenibacillus sp. IHBB 10380 TaxID=1566358 RepID=UPI001186FCAC|nr:hypothetical protein [Paenibacillus sp. IHBB 10380]